MEQAFHAIVTSYMKPECHFYIDDSGPRDPDRKPDKIATDRDWFALGGVLVNASDESHCKELIEAFRSRWPQLAAEPLRSYDIRHKTKRARWLQSEPIERQAAFYDELTELIISLPVHVLACVIDRPGYNNRYLAQYGPRRWKLCATAFNIVAERAAKVAIHRESRLRIYAEQSDKATEKQLKSYFNTLRNEGLPFNVTNSQKYSPLTQAQFRSTLFEFRIKTKQSALMQFADLVLWPVCQGGYDQSHRAYVTLVEAGKLIESVCTEENGLLGTKYSCFDPR